MVRFSKASARRLSIAAVAGAGLLASIGMTAGAAQAASSTQAGAPAPVNGPLVYSDSSPTSLRANNVDGTSSFTLDASAACDTVLGTTPFSPPITGFSYSPDGTKAVVSCNGALLTITGADLKRALFALPDHVPNGVKDLNPIWSPDGKTVYFARQSTNNVGNPVYEAWSIRTDGTGAGPVPGVPAGARIIGVAPSGAFLLSGPDEPVGSPISMLDPGASKPRPLGEATRGGTASLSPDGTKVAISWGFLHEAPENNITVENTDGSGNSVQLTHSGPNDFESDPVWSPDGKMVAFTDRVYPPNGSVSMLLQYAAADGSGVVRQLAGPLPAIHPFAWHNGPIPATPRPAVTRLAGADRVGTSVAVADAAYNPNRAGTSKADVAVISRSDTFADALAGNALAAQKHGPLLLTGSDKLDPAVAHELSTVLSTGATVYVLGGTQALSGKVEADLRALGLHPKRLAGSDRFQTATKIAAEVSPHPHTVMVATAINFPDALAAGAAAATDPNGGVVLLSNDKTLPSSTEAYLAGVNPATTAVYGVGGQGVAALKTLAGFAGHFTELAGSDRYATALAVADDTTLFPAGYAGPSAAGIATGEKWPDALSGGALIGALHGPLLLTDNSTVIEPGSPIQWLSAHRLPLNQIDVFGGPAVVQDSLLPEFGDYTFGKGNFDIH